MVLLTWTHPYISLFDMGSLILSFDSVVDDKKGNAGFLSNLYGYAHERDVAAVRRGEERAAARRGKGTVTPFLGVTARVAPARSRNKAHFGPYSAPAAGTRRGKSTVTPFLGVTARGGAGAQENKAHFGPYSAPAAAARRGKSTVTPFLGVTARAAPARRRIRPFSGLIVLPWLPRNEERAQ